MKDVAVSIKNTQEVEGVTETISVTSRGKYSCDEKGVKVFYAEEENGKKICDCELFVQGEKAVLTRKMLYGQTKMEFCKDNEYNFSYVTQFGEIAMTVKTDYINYDFTGFKGHIMIKYTLWSGGSLLSKNNIVLNVK